MKITPFLWFDTNAEEAVRFYVSVFPNAKIGAITRYPDSGPGRPGGVLTASFELEGLSFTALNGGPAHRFTEAISFTIDCADQTEVDYYWNRLREGGGREDNCGWLKDRFGLSWQVVPTALPRLLQQPDPARAARVMEAMLRMQKIVIADLEKAAA